MELLLFVVDCTQRRQCLLDGMNLMVNNDNLYGAGDKYLDIIQLQMRTEYPL